MKIRNLFIILFFIVIGCKDEFILESNNYDPIIVVDGFISNEDGPYTIKLSYAAPINKTEEIPIENCIVTIYENTGKSELLLETKPGIYNTSVGGLKGIVGNEYSLSIITPEGKEYISEYQLMKEPVGIESVYAEEIVKNHDDYSTGLPGYQFYTNTETSSNQDNYFLWKMTETYHYTIDYELTRVYLGLKTVIIDDTIRIQEEIVNDTLIPYFNKYLYNCWRTQEINYVFTGKTTNLTVPKISEQPLVFVSTDTKKLTNKYSILLNQYSIGKEAYYYWEGIEKQSTAENFLIATQPYNVRGNISNVNDPDELVFGYFTVASVSQKRIFVDKPKKPFYYTACSAITDQETIKDIMDRTIPPFYFVEIFEYGESKEGMISYNCIDCREAGGTNVKPDFWID